MDKRIVTAWDGPILSSQLIQATKNVEKIDFSSFFYLFSATVRDEREIILATHHAPCRAG